jgi:hypothetical protein
MTVDLTTVPPGDVDLLDRTPLLVEPTADASPGRHRSSGESHLDP